MVLKEPASGLPIKKSIAVQCQQGGESPRDECATAYVLEKFFGDKWTANNGPYCALRVLRI